MSKEMKELYVAKSLKDLNAVAEKKEKSIKISEGKCRMYVKLAEKMYQNAVDAQLVDEDEEKAYVLFMTLLSLMTSIRKTQEYKKSKNYFDDMLLKKTLKALDEAEKLGDSLKKRYEEHEALSVSKCLDQLDKKPETAGPILDNKEKKEDAQADVAVNGVEEKSEKKGSDSGLLTVTSLYSLLTDNQTRVILMDVRPQTDFYASHIMHPLCISVPPSSLPPGSLSSKIEGLLPTESKEIWATRDKVDFVVIVDWSSGPEHEQPTHSVKVLKNAIYKFEQDVIMKSEPLLLEGGYSEWISLYPTMSTNPRVTAPNSTIPASSARPTLDQVNYDLDLTFLKPPEVQQDPPLQPPSSQPSTPPTSGHKQPPQIPSRLLKHNALAKGQGAVSAQNNMQVNGEVNSLGKSSHGKNTLPIERLNNDLKSVTKTTNIEDLRRPETGAEIAKSHSAVKEGIQYIDRQNHGPASASSAPPSVPNRTLKPRPQTSEATTPEVNDAILEDYRKVKEEKERLERERAELAEKVKSEKMEYERLLELKKKEARETADLMRKKRSVEAGSSNKGIVKPDSAEADRARLERLQREEAAEDERLQLAELRLKAEQEAEEKQQRLEEEKQRLAEKEKELAEQIRREEERIQKQREEKDREREQKELQERREREERERQERDAVKEAEEARVRLEREAAKLAEERQRDEASLEAERKRKADLERLRAEKARLEQERIRLEKERSEQELIEKERMRLIAEQERLEREKAEKLKAERERLARQEREEVERRQREQAERERQLQEKRQREEEEKKQALAEASRGLVAGWNVGWDEKSRRVFYIDHASKRTLWDKPAASMTPKVYKTILRDEPTTPSSGGGLKRSYSSPNIAKMVADEANRGPTSAMPSVDRAAKPSVNTQFQAPVRTRIRNFDGVWGVVDSGLTGLRNMGNTCYMNSTLQCLSNTAFLTGYLIGDNYQGDINRENVMGTGGELAEEFAELIKHIWSAQYRSITPRDFKFAVARHNSMFAGYDQQDAQEFLLTLLDSLHEDLNKVRKRPKLPEQKNDGISDEEAGETAWQMHKTVHDSVIVNLFQGQYKSTVMCSYCGKKSVTFDTFMYLSLDIPTDRTHPPLHDCLLQFSKEEHMSGDSRWNCPQCKAKRDAVKRIVIWKLPPIVVIVLKRFYSKGMWREKISTAVDYPLEDLDLNRYVSGPHRQKPYNLFAVSNHYGTMEGGHYTAFCKNPKKNRWFKFDDQEVTECSKSNVKSPAAYFLFYSSIPNHFS